MPTLSPSEITDLINGTLAELGENRLTNLMSSLQEYVAMPRLLKTKRMSFGAGTSIDFSVATKTSGAARRSGLFDTDAVNVADVTIRGSVPWRFNKVDFAYDRRELDMNSSPRAIFNLIQLRQADAMTDLAKLFEDDFFGLPPSTTDELVPYGCNYWLPARAAAGTGFDSAMPSGFTSVGGISDATYDRYRHFTASYDTYTKTESAAGESDSLTQRLRLAYRKVGFKAPVQIPDYDTGMDLQILSTLNVVQRLEEAVEGQNESLGNDIASKDGELLFRKVPFTWAPWLDENSYQMTNGSAATDPILGLDFGVFKPTFLEGNFVRNDGVEKVAGQHNVYAGHYDSVYNIVCRDRRKNFVLNRIAT